MIASERTALGRVQKGPDVKTYGHILPDGGAILPIKDDISLPDGDEIGHGHMKRPIFKLGHIDAGTRW